MIHSDAKLTIIQIKLKRKEKNCALLAEIDFECELGAHIGTLRVHRKDFWKFCWNLCKIYIINNTTGNHTNTNDSWCGTMNRLTHRNQSINKLLRLHGEQVRLMVSAIYYCLLNVHWAYYVGISLSSYS